MIITRLAGLALLAAVLELSAAPSAVARGGHGFGGRGFGGHGFGGYGLHMHMTSHVGGGGMPGSEFAGGRRAANDKYVKASSAEMDKLLNTKIKSICRGC
jgi:hypothetical protein